MQQSEPNLQKCTLKCTTESIHEELVTDIKEFLNQIAFNSEINLQVIASNLS